MPKHTFFKDIDGLDSIKRMGLVVLMSLLVLITVCDLFLKKPISANILDVIGWLNAAFLSSVAAEKFSKRKTHDTTENQTTTNGNTQPGTSGPFANP